jgi:hypothetical protein
VPSLVYQRSAMVSPSSAVVSASVVVTSVGRAWALARLSSRASTFCRRAAQSPGGGGVVSAIIASSGAMAACTSVSIESAIRSPPTSPVAGTPAAPQPGRRSNGVDHRP